MAVPRIHNRISKCLMCMLGVAGWMLAETPVAKAATYYWDNNGTTAGFGTASGTWAAPTVGSATLGWSTSTTGALLPGSVTTTTADIINFGNGATGLVGGTITVSGNVSSGNITFASGSGTILLSGGTITLAAAQTTTVNNATNTIGSVLAGASTSFTKAGTGILVLTGTNTYTGATSVTAGTLRAGAAAGARAFGTNSAVTLSNTAGVNLDLNGFAQTIGSLAGGGATGGNVTLGNNATLTLGTNNTSASFAGIISGTGTSGLTKSGTGTQTLTGANSYSGTTTINAGTLNLGGGTANGSLTSTVLTLGGGFFNYSRTGTNTQSFTTTNINVAPASVITVASGNILNLGTVVRANGVTLDFSTGLGAGTVAALAASNTGGIMAGFNFGDTWAVANGTDLAIGTLGSYTQSSAAGDMAGNYNGFNIDVDSSQAPDSAITANSLRFSAAAANTLAMQGSNVVTTGGILVGSAVGGNLSTITGGTLTGAASRDLVIVQNNTSGGLTISSNIVNNTSTTLTKSGAGLVTLSGTNTFTGGVILNGGRLELAGTSALNSTAGSENAVTFGNGSTATLALAGNSVVIRSLDTNAAIPGTTVVENASASNETLTIGNSANANNTFAGIIRNGTGTGTLAITKAGTGTLTLSGANTYTGGTTLIAGTVVASNATSFGTGDISVTGNSRINAIGGLTYTNAVITVGAPLTLQIAAATPGTATFSGQLAGSSPITVIANGVNAIVATYAFTNTNNTFTGNIIMPAGTTGSSPTASGNDYFSFNSIGDGGNITFQKRGHTNAVIYTGTSAITFNTRQIALGSDFGGLYDGGGVNPVDSFQNNAANPAHTVTFNTTLTPTTIFSAGTFFFGGSNTGDNTFSGTISNPSNFNLGIGKADAGRWILTGANSYLGNVVITNGTLSVNAIDVAANDQPLGKSTLIQLGNSGTSGTLEFTGATNSATDKQLVLGNLTNNNQAGAGSIVNNSTSGSLTFSNTTFNNTTGATVTTVARSLTLGGSYGGINGANQILGVIQNNATAPVSLTVSGSIWALTNINTYSGTTTISGGTLIANSSASIGSGTSSNTLIFTGGTLQASGMITSPSTRLVTLTSTGLINTDGNPVSIAGIISSTGGLTKSGLGTLTLGAANTFTGATTVGSGILELTNSLALQTSPLDTTGSIAGDTTNGILTAQSALTIGGLTGNKDLASIFSTSGGYSGISALTLNVTTATVNRIYTGSIADGTVGMTLAKSGAGAQTFSAANSYTGATTIAAGGALIVSANDALGSTLSGTTVAVNASLGFSGGVDYTSLELVSGAGAGTAAASGPLLAGTRGFIQGVSGNTTFRGNIELNASGTSRIGSQDGASLTLTGTITQATGITTANILFRVGSLPGDFVTLSNAGNSFGGDSTVFTGATNTGYAGVRLGITNGLPTNLTISGFAGTQVNFTALDLAGFNQSLNGLITGGGVLNIINLNTTTPSTLTLNPTVDKVTTNTFILGGGALGVVNVVKEGAFTQTIAVANTYTGTTQVNSGTLIVGVAGVGSTAAASAVTVGGASASGTPTLGGTGTINGSLTISGSGAAGTLSPGTGTTGTLTANNGVVLASGSTFAIGLTDNSVLGTVNGGQSTLGTFPNPTSNNFLNITGGATISSGTKFSIDGTTLTFNPANTYSYQVMQGAGDQSGLGIDSVASPTQFSFNNFSNSASFQFTITGKPTGEVFLNVAPVPEPMAVGAFAAVGLLALRLRKFRSK